MSFNTLKKSLHPSTKHNFPKNYHLFFDNTHLPPSSKYIVLGCLLYQNLHSKLFTSSQTKLAPSRLGVLYRICQFFFSFLYNCPQFTRNLSIPVWNMHITCGGDPLIHFRLERMESKTFRLVNCPTLTCNAASLLSFIIILWPLLNMLTACITSSLGPAAPDCLLKLILFSIQIPYANVNQHPQSFIPSTEKLRVCPHAYDLNSFKNRGSWHDAFRDTFLGAANSGDFSVCLFILVFFPYNCFPLLLKKIFRRIPGRHVQICRSAKARVASVSCLSISNSKRTSVIKPFFSRF